MKKYTASDALNKAWEVFKQDPLRHLGVFLVIFLIIVFFDYLSKSNGIMQAVYFLVSLLLSIFIYGYALDNVRGDYNGIGEVINKYYTSNKIIHFLLYGIIMIMLLGIIVAPFLLAYAGKGMSMGVAAILSLIILVILLYIYVRFFYAPFYIIDKGMGAIDALSASWRKSKDNIWDIVWLYILSLLLGLLGLIMLLVGIILMMPIIYFMEGDFYDQTAGDSEEILEA